MKITPRITPKSGSVFDPKSSQVIRLEFPAQGYVNPANTTLAFDVQMTVNVASGGNVFASFQNNIQSIFSRVRLLYGSTPIEDIVNYNVIVRSLTEWTGTSQTMAIDQASIAEGIGGVTVGSAGFITGTATVKPVLGLTHVRRSKIHGVSAVTYDSGDDGIGEAFAFGKTTASPSGTAANTAPNNGLIRRYQVSFALGLFTQEKLIPTKFMASQLAIELTLASPEECMIVTGDYTGSPTYALSNVTLIPEILEFDSSYDEMFLKGLREGGVPIKFSSWHTYRFNAGAASNVNLMIQERSRSVKALFAVQRRNPSVYWADAHATFFDSSGYIKSGSVTDNTTAPDETGGTLQTYQFRIGGRYFPASPVQCSTNLGIGATSNGGVEAYTELAKALNIIGDYRLNTGTNVERWGVQNAGNVVLVGDPNNVNANTALNELDYSVCYGGYSSTGNPVQSSVTRTKDNGLSKTNTFAGSLGSSCFAMAMNLETTNGVEISGLNAEEQSDIQLMASWSKPQAPNFNFEVYAYYDSMLILRENNVLELIQ